MNADELLGLIEAKKQRRSEKLRHLGLEHMPVVHEITVAEKESVNKAIAKAKTDAAKEQIIFETVIKSMCGWDDAGEITDSHVAKIKGLYSEAIVFEIYRCICDFNYLGEQGVAKAKKS